MTPAETYLLIFAIYTLVFLTIVAIYSGSVIGELCELARDLLYRISSPPVEYMEPDPESKAVDGSDTDGNPVLGDGERSEMMDLLERRGLSGSLWTSSTTYRDEPKGGNARPSANHHGDDDVEPAE